MKPIKIISALMLTSLLFWSCEELLQDEESITSNPDELVGTWDRDSMVVSMEATVSSDQVLYHFFEEGTGALTITGDHAASLTYLWPLAYLNSFDDSGECIDANGDYIDAVDETDCMNMGGTWVDGSQDEPTFISSNIDMISMLKSIIEGSSTEQIITIFGISNDVDGSGNDTEHAFVEVLTIPIWSSLDDLDTFDPDSFRVAEYVNDEPTYTYDSSNFSATVSAMTLYKVTETDSTWSVDSTTTVSVSGTLALTNLTIPANTPTETAFIFDPSEFEENEGGPTQLTINADGTFNGIDQWTEEDSLGNETTTIDTFSGNWTADSINITIIEDGMDDEGNAYIDTFSMRYYVVGNNATFIIEESPCGDDAKDDEGNPISEDECLDEMENAILFDDGSLTAMTMKMRLYFHRSSSSRPFIPMFVQENKSQKINYNRLAIQSWKKLISR
ncbi:MAG: hypothetical protein HOD97_01790 [Candidatus Marinimicrobia bacterium]|jgi:hypothetical protein|nr:hypothetical protein [Candidatus Neomarinimicrobiota bacterium]MBT3617541.1 hypothetical protein [Candidatus Neomarinimicrobiota bacterium]MBT3829218.1 hypothetical protein [Candidatus Neomarinimicrobiota bacterium]MBT3996788.1 hypothetical protein [Candidatus Neomarinimicrobiota bacterium]MBT4280342.1 hypothetical protein [Candidatus Neomarinimicrobiota bacterium]